MARHDFDWIVFFFLYRRFLPLFHTYPHRADPTFTLSLRIVHLKAHPIVNLIVIQGNVILIDGVPFLQHNLLGCGSNLRRNQLLDVSNQVIRARGSEAMGGRGRRVCVCESSWHPPSSLPYTHVLALDSHFLSKTIVADDFNHGEDGLRDGMEGYSWVVGRG